MNTFLYPYHYIEPYSSQYMSHSEMANVAASLLYFDSVTLSRFGSPEQLGVTSSTEDISLEMQKIEEEHGIESIDQFFAGHLNQDFSCDNLSMLNYMAYRTKVAQFDHVYKPLIQEGVVKQVTLFGEIPDLNVDDFSEVLEAFSDWPDGPEELTLFKSALFDAGSIGLSTFFLRERLKTVNPSLLQRTDRDAKAYHWRTAFLLDLFTQTLMSAKLGLPLASFSDVHFKLRNRCVEILKQQGKIGDGISANRELEQKIFKQSLVALPGVLPKSPESILYVRQKLADELAEFRSAVKDVADDMKQGDLSSLTEEDVEYAVRKHFVKPVESLQRILSKPSVELARNLISTPSVTSGFITSIGMSQGFGASAVCSAVLAVAVPTLTASLKTLIDRQKEIEKSGVAFLLKSQKITS